MAWDDEEKFVEVAVKREQMQEAAAIGFVVFGPKYFWSSEGEHGGYGYDDDMILVNGIYRI